MVPFISQIKDILTQYQPKGNVIQVNAQHWNSPRIMWRSPKHPHGWRGEMRTRKAERNKLQNQNTKNKPRGKGKTKDKNRTTEHSCCKNYLQGGWKGDTGGNKTGEKRKERRINHTNFVKLKFCISLQYFPKKVCNSTANDQKKGIGQNPNLKVQL